MESLFCMLGHHSQVNCIINCFPEYFTLTATFNPDWGGCNYHFTWSIWIFCQSRFDGLHRSEVLPKIKDVFKHFKCEGTDGNIWSGINTVVWEDGSKGWRCSSWLSEERLALVVHIIIRPLNKHWVNFQYSTQIKYIRYHRHSVMQILHQNSKSSFPTGILKWGALKILWR